MLKLIAYKNSSKTTEVTEERDDNKNALKEKLDETVDSSKMLDIKMKEPSDDSKEIVKDVILQKTKTNNVHSQRFRPLPSRRASDDEEQELCGLVGVTFGSNNISQLFYDPCDNQVMTYPQFQGFATCLVAFAELHIKSAVEWNTDTLNFVLAEGKKLFMRSLDKNGGFLIVKEQVAKCFTISNKKVALHITEPIVIGVVECDNPRVYSLDVGLDMFLQSYEHCLCEIENKYFLIWKQSGSFFVFDCYGRTRTCEASSNEGVTALICMGAITTTSALFKWKSNLSPKSVYTLYLVKLKALKTVSKKRIKLVKLKINSRFRNIGPGHNILQGKNHTFLQYFKDVRCKHSMPISLMGVLYSAAHPPETWESIDVDKIVKMGHNFYERCMKYDFDQYSLENSFIEAPVGGYKFTCELIPVCKKRTWSRGGVFRAEEDMCEIKQGIADDTAHNFVIQVNQRCYGVFKESGHYYVIDPYPKNYLNTSSETSSTNTIVHQFNALNSLFLTLIHEIIQIPFCSTYSLFTVSILKTNRLPSSTIPGSEKIISSESFNQYQIHRNRIRNKSNASIPKLPRVSASQSNSTIGKDERNIFLVKNIPASSNNQLELVTTYQNTTYTNALETSRSIRMSQIQKAAKERYRPSISSSNKSSSRSSSCSPRAYTELTKFTGSLGTSSSSSLQSSDNFKSTVSNANKSPKSDRNSTSGKSWTLLTISNRSKKNPDLTIISSRDTCSHKQFESLEQSSPNNLESLREEESTPVKASSSILKSKSNTALSLSENEVDHNKCGVNRSSFSNTSDDNKMINSNFGKEYEDIQNPYNREYHGVQDLKLLRQNENLTATSATQIERRVQHNQQNRPEAPDKAKHCSMAVVGSASGTFESLNSLIKAGLQVTDRVLMMTPWGNYAVFRFKNDYFLYDGCTCYPDRFRKHDLQLTIDRLTQFQELPDIVWKILNGKRKELVSETSEVGSYFSCRGICEN